MALRQRRVDRSDEARDDADPVDDKKEKLLNPSKDVSFGAAFVFLFICRYFSVTSNIVHDCDEVFNYWEPLHYVLYKSGFQTWEYSSEFALRSYLYLLLHAVVGLPVSLIHGDKVKVFYGVRMALGFVSALTEAAFVLAISKRFGKRVAVSTLMLLGLTNGCFTASTTFLPSTFSMYAITLASAAILADRADISVAVAAFGVLVGWPFSGLAAVPLVIYALATGGFRKVFMSGFLTTIFTTAVSAAADRYFYGQWKLSIFNLVTYNVVGGGDSILYGVEGPLFYIRNGLNNFNIALLLALGLPIVLLFVRKTSDKYLLLVTSPLFIWLGFMSLQPHKEERFLYPIYPLICLAASATIERFPDMVPSSVSFLKRPVKILRPLTLSIILVISYSRTTALLQGYSAPMEIYRFLPARPEATKTVCVGSEWHRFPSSFFLPSSNYQVQWLDDGFGGLLPLPFNSSLGGTAAAPAYFNKRNQASPEQFVKDEATCDYLVELVLDRPEVDYRGDNESSWKVIAKLPFLDNAKSPALTRAFFIPWKWQSRNTFGTYRLLRPTD